MEQAAGVPDEGDGGACVVPGELGNGGNGTPVAGLELGGAETTVTSGVVDETAGVGVIDELEEACVTVVVGDAPERFAPHPAKRSVPTRAKKSGFAIQPCLLNCNSRALGVRCTVGQTPHCGSGGAAVGGGSGEVARLLVTGVTSHPRSLILIHP